MEGVEQAGEVLTEPGVGVEGECEDAVEASQEAGTEPRADLDIRGYHALRSNGGVRAE